MPLMEHWVMMQMDVFLLADVLLVVEAVIQVVYEMAVFGKKVHGFDVCDDVFVCCRA